MEELQALQALIQQGEQHTVYLQWQAMMLIVIAGASMLSFLLRR